MSYCNTGFSLLGRVIEVVTGEVWDSAVRVRLFEPLGLTHTATLPEEVLRYRAAMGHIEPPGHELHTASVWGLPRTAGPAGGICATSSDERSCTQAARKALIHQPFRRGSSLPARSRA